jgi:AraC family transcriptional regulator, regulatory protein of adaptative response / methylated-DNA-[protein]-cysteine methyltransferase
MIALKKSRYATNDEKWQAVLQRDVRANGVFFFSVKTTGVYCRPSCASRTPRRENVAFHPSCTAAEHAGFRACKRCQPNGPSAQEREAQLVAHACRILEANEKPQKLDELARIIGLSPFHFHRLFKKVTGLTPKAYATAQRNETVRQKLSRSGSITAAIYDAGYASNGRFYAKSSTLLGMKPRAFRHGGMGETIRFATGKCSLGSILVAASEKGICAIFLGDNCESLCRDLQDRFARAQLIAGDHKFEKQIAQVIELVENPKIKSHLPLDIRGTAFQQKVWDALTKIPVGKTATYAQIAHQIGRPKAIRAVGGACSANPLAVAIPCHRVVRADGNLSGYRWNVERKRALLQSEKRLG